MRRPHRNIEIFSLSVLDMFASALGAFIVCVVILFPHYKKDLKPAMIRAEAALEQARTDLRAEQGRQRDAEAEVARQQSETERARVTQANLARCRNDLAVCRSQLARNFLLVQVEWTSSVDVNLLVRDPRGNAYSWTKTNRSGRDYPNTSAQLSIDFIEGPGMEVWVDPEVVTGQYMVEYSIPRASGERVEIKTTIFDRTGRKRMAPAVLRPGVVQVAGPSLRVDENGFVTVR